MQYVLSDLHGEYEGFITLLDKTFLAYSIDLIEKSTPDSSLNIPDDTPF